MATAQDCEESLHRLAERLRSNTAAPSDFDRTLSCTLTDLRTIFRGRLTGGDLTDIEQTTKPDAQIRLTMTSDDLLKLVEGDLNMASAWATRRVQVRAGVRDLMKLRSLF